MFLVRQVKVVVFHKNSVYYEYNSSASMYNPATYEWVWLDCKYNRRKHRRGLQ